MLSGSRTFAVHFERQCSGARFEIESVASGVDSERDAILNQHFVCVIGLCLGRLCDIPNKLTNDRITIDTSGCLDWGKYSSDVIPQSERVVSGTTSKGYYWMDDAYRAAGHVFALHVRDDLTLDVSTQQSKSRTRPVSERFRMSV